MYNINIILYKCVQINNNRNNFISHMAKWIQGGPYGLNIDNISTLYTYIHVCVCVCMCVCVCVRVCACVYVNIYV